MKTATIFCHAEGGEGPQRLKQILENRGLSLTILFTPKATPEDFAKARDSDFLVVMGGSMSVCNAPQHPYLYNEIEILQNRLAEDSPTLGICLGSQLMAKALGKEVFKGEQGPEIGWAPLTLTEAGKNHPIRHLAGPETYVVHWHQDTHELPEGATRLAFSEHYEIQAYSVGKKALGLQCHPEVDNRQVYGWLETEGRNIQESRIAKNATEIEEQTRLHMKIMNEQADLFFNEWLMSVEL